MSRASSPPPRVFGWNKSHSYQPAITWTGVRNYSSTLHPILLPHLVHLSPPSAVMSSKPKDQDGGGYGEVRAALPVDTLEKYLEKNIPHFAGPINVKQFNVSHRPSLLLCPARFAPP